MPTSPFVYKFHADEQQTASVFASGVASVWSPFDVVASRWGLHRDIFVKRLRFHRGSRKVSVIDFSCSSSEVDPQRAFRLCPCRARKGSSRCSNTLNLSVSAPSSTYHFVSTNRFLRSCCKDEKVLQMAAILHLYSRSRRICVIPSNPMVDFNRLPLQPFLFLIASFKSHFGQIAAAAVVLVKEGPCQGWARRCDWGCHRKGTRC